ncbi:MAG: hypothetical protein EOP62_14565, partial [Sphingomonadales bacterium]
MFVLFHRMAGLWRACAALLLLAIAAMLRSTCLAPAGGKRRGTRMAAAFGALLLGGMLTPSQANADVGVTTGTGDSAVVSTAATSTTTLAATTPVVSGTVVTYTATVTGASPTGTVGFFDGASAFSGCSSVVLSGGTATCTATPAAGARSITARYSGDAINEASNSAAVTHTVYARLTTTRAVASITATVGLVRTGVTPIIAAGGVGTRSFALSGGTLPTGLTYNTSSGQLSGTPTTGLAATIFTVTVTDETPGTAQTASNTFMLMVNTRAATTTTLAATTPVVVGSAVTYTATVTGSSPAGTVSFFDGGSSITGCVSRTMINGAASCSATPAVGMRSITATYSGNTANAPSTAAAVTQAVSPPLTTTQTQVGFNGVVGAALAPVIPVTGVNGVGTLSYALSGGTLPTGLSFNTSNGQLSGTPTTALVAKIFFVTVTDQNPGTAQTAAVYFILEVSAATSTTTMAATTPVVAGSAVTYTATVTGVSPSGTVAFFDGGSAIAGCGNQTVSGGTATCATTPVMGMRSITATYSGDANNMTSTAAAVTQTVSAALVTMQMIPFFPGTVGAVLPPITPVIGSGGLGTLGYALSGGTLPTGLSFNTSNGQLTGTPTTALIPTVFIVTVSDQTSGIAQTSAKTFTLVISAATSTTTLAATTPVVAGSPVTYTA